MEKPPLTKAAWAAGAASVAAATARTSDSFFMNIPVSFGLKDVMEK
jgi:hypothetical protein